jgi:GH15 family glucan-1,4-alpha-glucosidase
MLTMLDQQQLRNFSLKVILDNQAPNGGFLACPVMPDYQFSWFRDGAYIAYALTLDGARVGAQHAWSTAAQWESVYRFHNWCAARILERQDRLERAIAAVQRGEKPDMRDVLNARYQLEGVEGPEDWPEFQLDGPGTWLWSLNEYMEHSRFTPLPNEWAMAVELTARYLAALWPTPCYDCWEERGTEVHISTLAAIYGGLVAAEKLLPELDYSETRDLIRGYIMTHGLTPNGELAKAVGLDMVDANLLAVSVPHGLLAPDDPLMVKTVERIERDLHAATGGVHRHVEDVYYGGGAWVLLALHLAWYYTELGDLDRAREIVAWVETQTDADGNLPEQVNSSMFAPDHYEPWVAQRGEIASPLLWTHAEYLILLNKLGLVKP